MNKLTLIIILSFSVSISFGQKRWSVEAIVGGGIRFLEYRTSQSNFQNMESYNDDLYVQDALIQVNYYSSNSLHRISILGGHSIYYIPKSNDIVSDEFPGGKLYGQEWWYYYTLGTAYRFYFSKNKISRFFTEGKINVGYSYGMKSFHQIKIDDDIVMESKSPFNRNPFGIQLDNLRHRAEFNVGYALLISAKRKITHYSLILNMSAGIFHSNIASPNGGMFGASAMLGLEYRFGK
jgi:hypothetical protein